MEEKFQYNALNLMDERCIIEVTVNYETMCVHLYDIDGALYPMYDFVKKAYVLNEEFEKMIQALSTKRLIRAAYRGNEPFQIRQFNWFFYTKRKEIKVYNGATQMIEKVNENSEHSINSSFFEQI
jgi:hypothetical protein